MTNLTKEIETIKREQINFLKHTLDVLRVGDKEMLADHAETIQTRINRLELADQIPVILANYQNKIDSRIKGLFGKGVACG